MNEKSGSEGGCLVAARLNFSIIQYSIKDLHFVCRPVYGEVISVWSRIGEREKQMGSDNENQMPSLVEFGSDISDPAVEVSDFELADLDGDRLEDLSPKNRKAVIRNEIRKVVREHGTRGITVSEVSEITGLSDSAVRTHLESLCKLREVYKQKRNKRLYLYYPNGKPIHSIGSERVENDGETALELKLAQGRNDQYFIHVLEKRFSLMEGETTEGAVMFPVELFEQFVEKGEKLISELEP